MVVPDSQDFFNCVRVCGDVQGDAVGPVGTRMVLGLKNQGSEGFNGTSVGGKSWGGFVAATLGRMELLLKEIIGGEAIGWSSVRALGVDREARVVRAGCGMAWMGPCFCDPCAGKFAIRGAPSSVFITFYCSTYCHRPAICSG